MNEKYIDCLHGKVSMSLQENQLTIPRQFYPGLGDLIKDFVDTARRVHTDSVIEVVPEKRDRRVHVSVNDCQDYSIGFYGYPLEMDEARRAYSILRRDPRSGRGGDALMEEFERKVRAMEEAALSDSGNE